MKTSYECTLFQSPHNIRSFLGAQDFQLLVYVVRADCTCIYIVIISPYPIPNTEVLGGVLAVKPVMK